MSINHQVLNDARQFGEETVSHPKHLIILPLTKPLLLNWQRGGLIPFSKYWEKSVHDTCIPCPCIYLFAYFRVVCSELLLTQPYFDLPRTFKLSESTVRKVRRGLISVGGGGGGVMIGGIFFITSSLASRGLLGSLTPCIKVYIWLIIDPISVTFKQI